MQEPALGFASSGIGGRRVRVVEGGREGAVLDDCEASYAGTRCPMSRICWMWVWVLLASGNSMRASSE